ncbi:dTDP-4-amino-4,6-dideoxygalactose transaminase, partial [Planctomycetota bacterium]
MSTFRIPFNRPALVGTEFDHVKEAATKGHFSADGLFTERCQALLQAELSVPKVLLTTSCTHALEMAALLLDIQPGD